MHNVKRMAVFFPAELSYDPVTTSAAVLAQFQNYTNRLLYKIKARRVCTEYSENLFEWRLLSFPMETSMLLCFEGLRKTLLSGNSSG